jgi:hypothetical protein
MEGVIDPLNRIAVVGISCHIKYSYSSMILLARVLAEACICKNFHGSGRRIIVVSDCIP